MVEQFSEYMHAQSTDMTLLYPTRFIIFLHTDDYNDCAAALPLLCREICKRFTAIVNKQLPKYPDYIQHARQWNLKFVPVHNEDEIPDEIRAIPPTPGHPSATMLLYGADARTGNDAPHGRVVGTLRNSGTLRAINTGLNPLALGGMYRDDNGGFTEDIVLNIVGTATTANNRPVPPPVPETSRSCAASAEATTRRSATDIPSNGNTESPSAQMPPRPATMLTVKAQMGKLIDSRGRTCDNIIVAPDCQTIEIHGRDTACKPGPTSTIIRVDSQEALNPHLTLRRMPDNRWGFCVHAETTVNEVDVYPGNNAVTSLPNHSTLLLPGPVQLYITF